MVTFQFHLLDNKLNIRNKKGWFLTDKNQPFFSPFVVKNQSPMVMMWSAMMESRTRTVVEVMRTPHWRWRSVAETWSAPHPCVVVVVIPRIGWTIHVIVIPIRKVGNSCHNWGCHNRSCHNRSWSHNRCWGNYYRWGWRTEQSTNKSSRESTPEPRVVMMAERHDAEAQCKCHDCQFLVHCFILHWKFVVYLSLFTLYNIP